MRRSAHKPAQFILVLIVAISSACGATSPVTPRTNHAPTILSVTALPESLSLGDSTTITCNAVDQDGDSLVYDWFTQLPLKISGAPQGVYLYGTTSHSRVLYYSGPDSLVPLTRVQVFARDENGLQDGVELHIYMRN